MLVVSKRGNTREEKGRLVDRLLAISGRSRGRRPVELTIVVESEIRPWRYPPAFDFQYGDWPRSEFEGGNVEPWPTTTNPDLAALITIVLLASAPLFGPPPAEIFDPVPHRDLVTAMVEGVESLLGDLDSDTRNVVLTLVRIWSTVATGEIRSKDGAADWALPRLPEEHRAVLARARAIYLGEEEEHWDDIMPQSGRMPVTSSPRSTNSAATGSIRQVTRHATVRTNGSRATGRRHRPDAHVLQVSTISICW